MEPNWKELFLKLVADVSMTYSNTVLDSQELKKKGGDHFATAQGMEKAAGNFEHIIRIYKPYVQNA